MQIVDLHNDFLTKYKNEKEIELYFESLIKNKKIKIINCVVWTTELKDPLNDLKRLKNIFDRYAKRSDKFLFSIEDLGFLKNNHNLSRDINFIKSLKPFSCGIVWNFDNSLGGGAFGKSGITPLGKYIVKELEKENIIIDTAHMNFKTFADFCKITSKPIFNSHTNLYQRKRHKRNLKPKQIKILINSNGFIGLSFVRAFVSNKSITSKNIAKEMKFFIKKYGYKSLGIGSDFFGTDDLPSDIKKYEDFKNLIFELKKLKVDTKVIGHIMYKNFLRFKKSLG